MGRNLGPVCRLCRQGMSKLFLKGERCNTKCPIDKKRGKPGNVRNSGLTSGYGLSLRQKQALKYRYSISETQFSRHINEGIKSKDIFQNLERLLINVVYKCGWAVSRNQARQLISHRFVFVKRNDVVKLGHPTMLIDKDDLIIIKKNIDPNIHVSWLEKIEDGVKVLRLPTKDDIDCDIDENMVINFYSR